MQVIPYAESLYDSWNVTIDQSKNGTFLFHRDFMDYHKERFVDCSLLFQDKKTVIAVLPACWESNTKIVSSHAGLTYGGLILHRQITAMQVWECLQLAVAYYKQRYGAVSFIYKSVPYIYHTYPAQEELYALYKIGATLAARSLSSTIVLPSLLPMRSLRVRGVKKALKAGWIVRRVCPGTDSIQPLWNILEKELKLRHHTHPVHTADEMETLWRRFPENIAIYVVEDEQRKLYGGTVLFKSANVVHVQYITSTEVGRNNGALDLLFCTLIQEMDWKVPYFDFGISTEQGGQILNEGLLFQKEGFGARGVCYDIYKVCLNE